MQIVFQTEGQLRRVILLALLTSLVLTCVGCDTTDSIEPKMTITSVTVTVDDKTYEITESEAVLTIPVESRLDIKNIEFVSTAQRASWEKTAGEAYIRKDSAIADGFDYTDGRFTKGVHIGGGLNILEPFFVTAPAEAEQIYEIAGAAKKSMVNPLPFPPSPRRLAEKMAISRPWFVRSKWDRIVVVLVYYRNGPREQILEKSHLGKGAEVVDRFFINLRIEH